MFPFHPLSFLFILWLAVSHPSHSHTHVLSDRCEKLQSSILVMLLSCFFPPSARPHSKLVTLGALIWIVYRADKEQIRCAQRRGHDLSEDKLFFTYTEVWGGVIKSCRWRITFKKAALFFQLCYFFYLGRLLCTKEHSKVESTACRLLLSHQDFATPFSCMHEPQIVQYILKSLWRLPHGGFALVWHINSGGIWASSQHSLLTIHFLGFHMLWCQLY